MAKSDVGEYADVGLSHFAKAGHFTEITDTHFQNSNFVFFPDTEDGQRKLAFVDKHFLLDRYRYLEKFSVDVPHIPEQEDWQSVSSGPLHHQALVWIRDLSKIDSFSMGQNYGPNIYLALIPMIVIEYLAYCFLFKRDEL